MKKKSVQFKLIDGKITKHKKSFKKFGLYPIDRDKGYYIAPIEFYIGYCENKYIILVIGTVLCEAFFDVKYFYHKWSRFLKIECDKPRLKEPIEKFIKELKKLL